MKAELCLSFGCLLESRSSPSAGLRARSEAALGENMFVCCLRL